MLPFELVATPTASPRYRLSGSLIGSTASYGISGIASWARITAGLSASARRTSRRVRLMAASPDLAGRALWQRLEEDLLGAPRRDLDHDELVGVAAVDRVDGTELTERLAGFAELADHGAVELHLVDLAAHRREGGNVVVRIRIRREQVLVRSRADAHRPRRADVVVDGAQHELAVEHLNAAVLPVGHVDVALGVGGDRVRDVQLIRLGATRPDRLDEAPVLVVLRDARVDVAIGHVDVAGRIPGDVGRAVEAVRLGRRRGGKARSRLDTTDRLGTPAHGHQHPPFGVELHDHVRAFVHGPDVVLRVHADGVRHLEAVETLADLADEGALLIELEQPRVAAAREDEDVALRIARHADPLAEVEVGRQLEEVGH